MKKYFLFFAVIVFFLPSSVFAASFKKFEAKSPIHIRGNATLIPQGLSPQQIRAIYNLPLYGGKGTIAIIGAYDDSAIEKDLAVFSQQFGLLLCTTKNGCFEKHKMMRTISANNGWALETSLDVEWAHAIAPDAKILLIEAKSASGSNLLAAIDYARRRSDVVAVSMSWGGPEFDTEADLENHFTGDDTITFFASSGDNGAGVSWPAVSPHVVGVGGTSVQLSGDGKLKKETAWSGSGGGVSVYFSQPDFQKEYSISKAHSKRAVPDVSYNADPNSGFAVYDSMGMSGQKGWFVLGGTSAGAPQWAAIKALGLSASNKKFYQDKAAENNAQYFRDIMSGKNGDCSYYCTARKHYDYVTGLGSPLGVSF